MSGNPHTEGPSDLPGLYLEPGELAMMGHALRMVPSNACLTSGPLAPSGLAMFPEIPEFASLWAKVAAAITERDDMAAFRGGAY